MPRALAFLILAIFAFESSRAEATAMSEADKRELLLPLAKIPEHYEFEAAPTVYPLEFIQSIVTAAANESAKKLDLAALPKITLLATREWASYVNYHHFVPLQAEGVPVGEGFNFTFNETGDQKSLPNGEVIETGEMYIWAHQCNFFGYTKQECVSSIRALVSHEMRHYVQWKKLQQTGTADKWFDLTHYQCREVEVYVAQTIAGEREAWELSDPSRLHYLSQCMKSRWKTEFAPHIEKMRKITKR